MSTQEFKERETKSINLILVGISLIIFGGLGIIFITQMELHPGWAWEDYNEEYPIELYALEGEDITGDGMPEIVTYADITRTHEEIANNTPKFGGVFLLNGRNGGEVWSSVYRNPVKRVFHIMDVDGDTHRDFFVETATVSPNWTGPDDEDVDIYPNMFSNNIISGLDGSDLSELPQVGSDFTNLFVADLISLDEDIICLEAEYNETLFEFYWNITSYFINGTKKHTLYVDTVNHLNYNDPSDVPGIEIFSYGGEPHLLYIEEHSIRLLNLSPLDFLNYTYNEPLPGELISYTIIEDLNSDDISEILFATRDQEILLVNGSNGKQIRNFSISYEFDNVELTEVPSLNGDGQVYFVTEASKWYGGDKNEIINEIYSLTLGMQNLEWSFVRSGHSRSSLLVLDEDFDGDLINEIVYHQEVSQIGGMEPISRYKIFNFMTKEVLGTINIQYSPESMLNIADIDGDGKRDFLICEGGRLIALSTTKPTGIWLSTEFGYGLPLFIVLTVMLGAGVLILIIKSRDLRKSRKKIKASIKEKKLTVAVNVLVLILMTLCFILFLFQLNIFNNTLISNHQMTDLIIIFISVIIIWYAILPLTAAIYNQFAPHFAFIFVKLRSLFFKISKGYNHEILVVDMKDRREIGIIIKIKRVILPLLLSIAVGFYIYNTFAPTLGYSQGFNYFGSTEFFSFIIGYMALCLLPMILSYLLFAFFISGNFLLDDAGIIYYKESKKYRQPGDIEPISIWAQSLVKGVAGLSALITFGSFFLTVDFSGFFRGEILIFGILMVFVMFWGAPFLTCFSYILFAGEVMEYSIENNAQKLYQIMEKNGYDITPHDITNLYPSGYEPSEKESLNKFKNSENNPSN